eukprot:11233188-Prorocentrum_lima.AAC.1
MRCSTFAVILRRNLTCARAPARYWAILHALCAMQDATNTKCTINHAKLRFAPRVQGLMRQEKKQHAACSTSTTPQRTLLIRSAQHSPGMRNYSTFLHSW